MAQNKVILSAFQDWHVNKRIRQKRNRWQVWYLVAIVCLKGFTIISFSIEGYWEKFRKNQRNEMSILEFQRNSCEMLLVSGTFFNPD